MLPICYICDNYLFQFKLIRSISYTNQQMTTFLKQVHTFTRKGPSSSSPFFFLLEQFKCLNNESDKQIFS